MSICKFNNLYKPANNSLQIDMRIKNYDYQIDNKNIVCYIFNKNYHCIYVNNIVVNPLKNTLKTLFPIELIDFFKTILENSLEHEQLIHTVLNNRHILYRCSTFHDNMNRLLGYILYEMPFTKVQLLIPNNTFEKLPTCLVIDRNGYVKGIENINWNKLFEFEDFKSTNIINKSILTLLRVDYLEYLFKKLRIFILENHEKTVSFSMYWKFRFTTKRLLFTFSKFVDSSQSDMILVAIETIESNEVVDTDNIPEYLTLPISNRYSLSSMGVLCCFCNRIKIKCDKSQLDTFMHHKIYYNHTIKPLHDIENNTPIFGQRGCNGQQSYKCNSFLWLNEEHWYLYKKKFPNSIPSYTTKSYNICQICKDEWEHFIINNLQ